MSDSTVYNLLAGTMDWSGDWANAGYWYESGTHDGFAVMRRNDEWQGLYKPVALTAGTTYTFSAMARVPAGKRAHAYLSSGGTVNDTYLANSEFAGGQESVVTGDGGWFEIHLTFTPTTSKAVKARIEADGSYAIEVCALMLVEGTTPAAWAPAEGESLAGGGCVHER